MTNTLSQAPARHRGFSRHRPHSPATLMYPTAFGCRKMPLARAVRSRSMTTRRDETPVRRRAKAASPDRFTAWLVWPVSTVLFGGLAMLLASAVSSERARTTDDLWNAIRTLGRWAEPAFSSGFDALAVFGTIVVAVAAITGFSGDWSGLIARARSLLSALTVLASILLLGLATLTPAVIVASPETSSETILLWLAGWGVMLVTLAISEVMPLRSQVVLARVRAVRAERRAERAGYDLPPRHASPPARPTGALITLLAAPVVLWVIFSTSVAATMHVSERTAVLFVFVGYGGLITLIGWWAGNDATAPRLSRVFAVFIVTTGVIMTFALALSSPPFGHRSASGCSSMAWRVSCSCCH